MKMPRCSSTSSWTIFGTWNSIRLVRVAIASFRAKLLRVELDDQRLLDGGVDLVAIGCLEDLAGEAVVVGLEPGSDRGGQVGRVADYLLGGRARLEHDHVVRLDLVRRNVHPPTVDEEVAVADELPRLRPGRGEAEPVDDVVQACLEHAEQVVARHARLASRLVVVGPELLLEQA